MNAILRAIPLRLAVLSRGIRNISSLPALLGVPALSLCRWGTDCDAVLGWGYKPTADRARKLAARHGLPYVALEDGFVRSLGLGVEGYPPLSIVVDDLGIYYDATRPSRLEALVREVVASDVAGAYTPVLPLDEVGAAAGGGLRRVAANPPYVGEEELTDARRAMGLLVRHRLSKYNHAPDFTPPAGWEGDAVLVVDQTFGDMAVRLGGADEASFRAMLSAALADNPGHTVWVKTHPDVMCGKKRGYLTDLAEADGRVQLLPLDVNPMSLLPHVGKVYAVTSQLGFEALLCGKPVATFGLPWYAGWGLTEDRHPQAGELAARRGPATLAQLFAGAYLRYCRYLNPETGERGTIFDVIGHLARARRANEALRGELVCVGFSLWKRAVVTPFLRAPATRLRFVRSAATLRRLPPAPDRRVLAWGAGRSEVRAVAAEKGLPLVRMEDGFIRSVGLGSNLVPPLSLVVDDLGIYFDPRTPSRLEALLQAGGLAEDELAEAAALRAALLAARIGKYNVGSGGLALPQPRPRQVILVPGQVEDDASIRTGSPWVSTNLALLQAVRAAHPQAYIVFKPHPDVVSGNRTGAVPAQDARALADAVVPEADVIACLEMVDEVHTMTSLTGFEALLRGKKVVCYGAPFYAGWGLTEDVFAPPTPALSAESVGWVEARGAITHQHHGEKGGQQGVGCDAGGGLRRVASNPPYVEDGAGAVWVRRTRHLLLDELVAGTLLRYPRYVDPHSRALVSASRAVALLQAQKATGAGALRRSWAAQQWGKLCMLLKCLIHKNI